MVEKDFIDIYIEQALIEIKSIVGYQIILDDDSNQDINELRIEKIDQEMRRVLRKIVDEDEIGNVDFPFGKRLSRLHVEDDDNSKLILRSRLIVYYAAMYFDNISLLEKFIKAGVDFGFFTSGLSLGVFDPQLVALFDEDDYIELVRTSKNVLANFYHEVKNEDEKEKRKYFSELGRILNGRKDLWGIMPGNTFNKAALDIFDEESYMKASLLQIKGIITAGNQYEFFKDEKIKPRINHLLQETDFASNYADAFAKMMELFSDEELVEVERLGKNVAKRDSKYVGNYFFWASDSEEDIDIERIKKLFFSNPYIINYSFTYDKLFLELFSDEEISEMSYDFLSSFRVNCDRLLDEPKFIATMKVKRAFNKLKRMERKAITTKEGN